MGTTLTIRLDPTLKRALDERARLRRQSVSATVREILDEAVAERPLGDRVGHLAGRLGPPGGEPDERERHLRETNWRP
jgi:plasmid stability protein